MAEQTASGFPLESRRKFFRLRSAPDFGAD